MVLNSNFFSVVPPLLGLCALCRAKWLLPTPAVGLLCRLFALWFLAQRAFQQEKRERQLLQEHNQKLPEDHSMVA